MSRLREVHLLTAAVVAVLALGSIAGFRYMTSPNRQFLNYVHTDATQWRSSALPGRPQQDQAWLQAHGTAVLAEGQRACAWLATQRDAPSVIRAERADESRMAMHYVTKVEGHDVPLANMTKWYVVGGAWTYLCRDQMSAKTAPDARNDD
jgi:type VI protein secretion system component VasK